MKNLRTLSARISGKKAYADIRRKNLQINLSESNLKIYAPFPRESAEKKLTQIFAEKTPQIDLF
jgi:hypothetical protein